MVTFILSIHMVFYISQLVRFARIYNNVSDFSDSNLVKTEKTIYILFWWIIEDIYKILLPS